MPLLSLSIFQLLLAFVSASILFRLTYNSFFLKWLASHRLVCYLAPSNDELKKLKNRSENASTKRKSSKLKARSRKAQINAQDNEELFKIPTADLEFLRLDEVIIEVADLELISYSVDLEWIVDLAIMSIFSLIITDTQFYFYPQTTECNFSLLWALLVIFYCIKILWKLTTIYFKNKDSIGERSICIISTCFFHLLAMLILTINDGLLEFGLENAFLSMNGLSTTSVNNRTTDINSNLQSSRPALSILVRFFIATICSLIGAVFTFPGMRFGQLQRNVLDKSETSRLLRILYNLNYVSPLIVVSLWIRPIFRELVLDQNLIYVDDAMFDSMRILLVIIINVMRFFLVPGYASIFLASAKNRLHRIKCRGGSTSNRELQVAISSIYNYINVMVIQYILPILMSLFTVIMFKSLGGHSWVPISESSKASNKLIDEGAMSDFITANFSDKSDHSSPTLDKQGILSIASSLNMYEIRNMFPPDVYKGLLGFATWWLHFSWFCTSTAGMIYHNYFTH